MKRFLILLFFISFYGNSQEFRSYVDNANEADKICAAFKGKGFETEKEAEEALNKILSVIGASKRFVLQSCQNIPNAMAISWKGIRYIYYNQEFMNEINSNTDYWSNMSILAHEIGHHINGHTIDGLLFLNEIVEEESLAESRKMELEADEFAGFVLAKLGAALEEASKAINLISSNKNDNYSTHPSRSKRLEAISNGYNKAIANVIAYKKTSLNTADEYFYSAYKKAENKDYYGAIADYADAIDIDPNFAKAYVNRGIAKENLGDIKGACEDWKKSISLGYTDAKNWVNNQCK